MAAVDEISSEIITSLNAFDFSPAFPQAYTGTKAVMIVKGWPYDLVDNMLSETNGQMTRPIISVTSVGTPTSFRSLGNLFGSVAAGVAPTYAMRVEASFLISAWADQSLGGTDTVEKLGGLLEGWALLNQNSLTAYRHLRISTASEVYADAPQLWRYDATVHGDAILSIT